ncbi:MAG: hypothetical protein P8M49_01410 [Thalassotalea sp.]|nr:hypothetical protein [Thalassotalea sp.]MDG2392139.1 hypothetical protein [Thalassotalea sp.]
MNRSSLREIKLSTVFCAVLILGASAMFSSSNATQDIDINEIIEQEK